ncbi:MAG TPA: DUF4834 family protein [Cytophagaceae bacterium]
MKPIIKMVINSMINKVVQNGGAPRPQSNRPFGSINVDQDAPTNNSKRSKDSNEGEYVDYEEVK